MLHISVIFVSSCSGENLLKIIWTSKINVISLFIKKYAFFPLEKLSHYIMLKFLNHSIKITSIIKLFNLAWIFKWFFIQIMLRKCSVARARDNSLITFSCIYNVCKWQILNRSITFQLFLKFLTFLFYAKCLLLHFW